MMSCAGLKYQTGQTVNEAVQMWSKKPPSLHYSH